MGRAVIIPDYVWTHLAGWFLGMTTLLFIGWFSSLNKRVGQLEEEVEKLEQDLSKRKKTIERLRNKLGSLGIEPSEVEEL